MSDIRVSLFADRSGAKIDSVAVSWETLVQSFSAPPIVADKSQCQLFSLCEFGDKRTENGSLRSNDNVVRVWGVCGDYDGEKVPMLEAVDALNKAGVTALAYTSPSHTAAAPRWRIVAPFTQALPPDEYAPAVERLNTIVGGGLSSESFTLSQPFYVGRTVATAADFMALSVMGGRTIEQAADIPRTPWRGARNAEGGYRVDTDTLIADLSQGVEIHPAIVALAARGFTQEELEDIVRRNAHAWERPERAQVAIEQDIPRACNSWARKQQRELERKLAAVGIPPVQEYVPKSPRRNRFAHLSALIKEPPPLVWLIDGVIEHPTLVAVFGESGAGKSYMTVDWGLSIAAGRDWNGRKVKQGPVVYFCGEGHTGMKRRYKAWEIKNGVNVQNLPFYQSERAWSFMDNEVMYGVIEDIDALVAETGENPAVIFIDTLTRHTPGMDQNSPKEVPEFIRRCDDLKDRYKCTVVIVAHSGLADKGRIMGSSTLKGTLDVELAVLKAGKGYMKLHSTKMKDGEQPPDMKFKFEVIALPWLENATDPNVMPKAQTSSVIVPVANEPEAPGELEGEGKASKAARCVIEALQGGGFIAKSDARATFKRLYGGEGDTAAKAFNRAVRKLIDGGRVIEDADNDTVKLVIPGSNSPNRTQPDK